MSGTSAAPIDTQNWTVEAAEAVIALPFHELLTRAHATHCDNFDPAEIEAAKLMSIKTGACPEDCAYCPQSAHHDTGLKAEPLAPTGEIVAAAKQAQAEGATRFCMGAAWRSPSDKQVEKVAESIEAVAALGLETCVTLGMLEDAQAQRLADAGLDFYNHNLDTSPEHYGDIITTRTYQDRLDTLDVCRDAGLKLCTGGIVGMGESRTDRASMLVQLANLSPQPESVPINLLIRSTGTPLETVPDFPTLELVRTIAAARVLMPQTVVRLSAGRAGMTDELHALCFYAGANSIFLGDTLLTAGNNGVSADDRLLDDLGLSVAQTSVQS